ncbi:hypothetical protein HD597_005965 [Nonomuraea thailandensis]|uniref:Ig-like domain-containing protein n=1 Tax=Nonomuraea thailandensis TaxID=1188745 RepID=A0A9X2K467_9ACTN|nr:hypothetical protein [Nonomuraea thailandensis]MCP2358945.1 hypothetical protein [Nonomuraea thailandensis]
MRRTALLLGAALLSGLLAAPPPAAASAPGPAVKVAQVKASPAKQSGGCPTTVGFSAVIAAAKGAGTVRYRWVRGDGSRSAVKSARVSRTRAVVVRDRQTFDRTTSGWQAVEVLGRKGLSAKARFSVTCRGPVTVWDDRHHLPARPGKPLVAAASVTADPPSYGGTCPATVRFTGTIQVSRTPAKVDYQWIDSATGEGQAQSLSFASGGPRSRQVVLPMAVGSSTSGWKAIRLITAGHDSGRAAYQVTCRSAPPASPPPTTPAPTTPAPTTPAPTPPPTQKPVPSITGLTPGDYAGECLEPVAYQATGRIALPAGPAAKVTYWWILDGNKWQQQVLDFAASDQPRAQDVTAAWSLERAGAGRHTLGLMTEGGPAEPVTREFAFSCTDQPGDAKLTFHYLLTPVFHGVCDGSYGLRADGLVTTDREAEVKYRLVIDGKPGPTRSEVLRPGVKSKIGDFWYGSARTSGTGTVRLEVLNHDKPFMQESYTWTCKEREPSPGAVEITELWPVAYHGDCADAPYVTAHGAFAAAPGTEITYRWVTDGDPTAPDTLKVGQSGILEVQAAHWDRPERKDGTVVLEVLNHNKPAMRAAYPVTCR